MVRLRDLVASVADSTLAHALRAVSRPLEAGLAIMARRLYGRATSGAVQRVACAVVDLPHGAIRRHLVAGTPLPGSVRPQLAAAIRAALAETVPSRTAAAAETSVAGTEE